MLFHWHAVFGFTTAHLGFEDGQLALGFLVFKTLGFLALRVVVLDLLIVAEQQVHDDRGRQGDCSAAGYYQASAHAGQALVHVVAQHVAGDLCAYEALDNHDNYEQCARRCERGLIQRVQEQTDNREDEVRAGTIVDGVHALAAARLVTSVGSDAVRRAQRAGECRIRGNQRKDNVADAADNVGAVCVELDVLVFANSVQAKLLHGDEVAVSDDPCGKGIGDSGDPDCGIGAEADAERGYCLNHGAEVGDHDDLARELVLEFAGKATDYEQSKHCPQEAVIAKQG